MSWFFFRLLACLAFFCGATLSEAGMTPKRTVLSNGMVLLTSEQRTLPMVSIRFDSSGAVVHRPVYSQNLVRADIDPQVYRANSG